MFEFTNPPIDIDNLPKYQEVSFTAINKKYWNVVVINLSIFAMILLGVLGIVFLSVFTHPETEVGAVFYITFLGVAIGFIIFLFWINHIAFQKKSYAIREKDILYRSGVLATSTTIIPIGRIQHIAVTEGVLSRMYGLASVEVYTAGGSSSDLRIPGIAKDKAYSIKEFLMNNIDSVEGRTDHLQDISADAENNNTEAKNTTDQNIIS